MKYIINESSLLPLIVSFLETMKTPVGVCYVSALINNKGEVNLTIHLDKMNGYNVETTSPRMLRNMDGLYRNKVQDYFGVRVNILFGEDGDC
jgi:hypothetical protein